MVGRGGKELIINCGVIVVRFGANPVGIRIKSVSPVAVRDESDVNCTSGIAILVAVELAHTW